MRGLARCARLVPAATVAAALLLGQHAAWGADKKTEAAAVDALNKSSTDYLSMDYDKAAGRLQKAIKACGSNKCTSPTKAALFRDLGTMQFRKGDQAAARRSFASALRLAADLSLNPDYDAPDLRAAWQDAGGTVVLPSNPTGGSGGGGGTTGGGGSSSGGGGTSSGGGSSSGGGGGSSGGGGAVDTSDQPEGDFAHTPPEAQRNDTPLPVYFTGGGEGLKRVLLKYKGAGMRSWKRIELKKVGEGWGGLIPCADVNTGTMRYYVQGLDANGENVASTGDPKHAFVVPIKREIDNDPPHLPGKSAPKSCEETSDCPPDFPGCSKSGETETGPDDSEKTDKDTSSDEDEDKDKDGDEKKKKDKSAYSHFWVGIAGSFDLIQLPQGVDLCRLYPQPAPPGQTPATPANSAGYYCTNPDGSDFPTRSTDMQNSALVKGQAGNLSGGPALGTMHLMLAADYAIIPNFLVGLRLGYVPNGYPGQAAITDGRASSFKFHLEARVTYIFGDNPLGHAGFAPLLFLGGGAAEFDAHNDSTAQLQGVMGAQPVSIWLTDGPGFIAGGAGIRYAASSHFAFSLSLRGNVAFGAGGTLPSLGPELTAQAGF